MPDVEMWHNWCADAWTDDWTELCDDLGIDYSKADLNSRELRKLVTAWANTHDWERVLAAIASRTEPKP